MEINKNDCKNKSPNLQFYKILEIGKNSFDIYKLDNKSSNGYLAVANDKNIDIYKINSEDDIKLIHSIKVEFKDMKKFECKQDINCMKYYYDSYHDCHYLTILINNHCNILIYKIKEECKYDLIFNHSEMKSQGGYSMSRRPIYYRLYELIFNKDQAFLILFYVLQRGCCYRAAYIDVIDFINQEKYEFIQDYDNEYGERRPLLNESIMNIHGIKKSEKNYIGFLEYNQFYLYNLSLSNLISNPDSYEEMDEKAKKIDLEIIKLPEELRDMSKESFGDINSFLVKENNDDEYLYIYQAINPFNYWGDDNKDICNNNIYKININNNQIIYKSKINVKSISSMVLWNEKYLLIFEYKGSNISLFNMKTAIIEKIFNHGDNVLCNGKKLIINNDEELLFVIDNEGTISLWINSKA